MSGTPSRGSPPHGKTVEGGTPLDHLRGLLEQQLQLVRQSRWADAAELFDRTDRCVREIGTGIGGSEPVPQWQSIERLYHELSLALAAQREEVLAALKALRRGKKALSAYSGTRGFRR